MQSLKMLKTSSGIKYQPKTHGHTSHLLYLLGIIADLLCEGVCVRDECLSNDDLNATKDLLSKIDNTVIQIREEITRVETLTKSLTTPDVVKSCPALKTVSISDVELKKLDDVMFSTKSVSSEELWNSTKESKTAERGAKQEVSLGVATVSENRCNLKENFSQAAVEKIQNDDGEGACHHPMKKKSNSPNKRRESRRLSFPSLPPLDPSVSPTGNPTTHSTLQPLISFVLRFVVI